MLIACLWSKVLVLFSMAHWCVFRCFIQYFANANLKLPLKIEYAESDTQCFVGYVVIVHCNSLYSMPHTLVCGNCSMIQERHSGMCQIVN